MWVVLYMYKWNISHLNTKSTSESLNIDNSTNDLKEIILNLIDKADITPYSDTYGYNANLQ